jgi:hypothetical protein
MVAQTAVLVDELLDLVAGPPARRARPRPTALAHKWSGRP